MISFLKGEVIYKDDKRVILDKDGIGFEVFLAPDNLEKIKTGEDLRIFTFLFLGEKVMELYGFLTEKELELFRILKGVSGVGPKTAMNLAVLQSIEKLKEALENGKMPAGVKGVGAKKLQKILLEITGKIEEIKKIGKKIDSADEVYGALSKLGFSRQDIAAAIAKIPENIKGPEERVKLALKYLAK
ncbi:MAG: Holliday junction ATP-dependent DNA helicase RuvA [Candidatus Pacebacteria bacterium]|nr:Holliday junction ATP-dependent DNA helicase RuvA [Candidatus Paceibacterota bacterium]